ncbi:oxygenase MpaB family protein [Niabella aurantiaca]|uniref:oxygenase MpaB family protein n=1 Tax=Niabella aurantiaca TaxID=379900 RepID=UPI00037E0CCC|nr:oxygenase MpaB family protein [Niabella aurantiaca]
MPARYQINTTSFDHYWKKGAGAQLLLQLGYTPDVRAADRFRHFLFEWDRAGDVVADQLYAKTGFVKAQEALSAYMKSEPVDPEPKRIFDHFFAGIDLTPSWLDHDKIDRGIELSQRSGIPGLLVLRNYCLMGGYESAAINKPLIYTGALKKGAAKRLTETTLFWVNITRKGAFKKGGKGLYHVISTRFIHSFSRSSILGKTDWDNEQWGIPLNTWDMLATHLGFSLVFLTGLRRMGFRPSAEETEGLFHLWKYVGYLLGIPLELLPEQESEAIEALYYWTMTQPQGDTDSVALAQALIGETVSSGFPRSLLLRKLMQQIHLFYNHFFLGPYSCRLLQIPRPGIGNIACFFLWRLRRMERKMNRPQFRQMAIRAGGARQANALDIYLKYKRH